MYDRWNWHSSRTSVKIRIGLVPPRDHQSYIIVSRYSIPMFSKSAHNPISFRSLTIFLLLLLFLFVFSLSLSLSPSLSLFFVLRRTNTVEQGRLRQTRRNVFVSPRWNYFRSPRHSPNFLTDSAASESLLRTWPLPLPLIPIPGDVLSGGPVTSPSTVSLSFRRRQ